MALSNEQVDKARDAISFLAALPVGAESGSHSGAGMSGSYIIKVAILCLH